MNVLSTILLFFGLGSGWFFDYSESDIDSLHQQIYPLLESDPDAAMILADSSLELSQKTGYEFGEANSYYIKAYVYDERDELNKAFYLYLKAMNLLQGKIDQRSIRVHSEILLNSGAILTKYFKYNEALELYNKGLSIANDNLPIRMKILYNVAYCLRRSGMTLQASEVLDEAFELAVQLNENKWKVECWNLYGLINKDEKNYLDARSYYERILASKFSSIEYNAQAYHNVAVTYKEEGKYDSAKFYFEKALSIKQELNDSKLLFSTLYEIADLNFAEENYNQAEIYASQAESLHSSLMLHPELYQVFHLLNLINLRQLNITKGEHYSNMFFQKSKEFNDKQEEIIIQYKQAQIDLTIAGFALEQKAEAQQKRFNLQILFASIAIICLTFVAFRYFSFKKYISKREAYRTKKFKEFMDEPEMQNLVAMLPSDDE